MKIKKRVQGHDIILDYRVLKKYPHFTRYKVYKMLSKTKRLFLYTTCLTSLQIKDIKNAGYILTDEEVFN